MNDISAHFNMIGLGLLACNWTFFSRIGCVRMCHIAVSHVFVVWQHVSDSLTRKLVDIFPSRRLSFQTRVRICLCFCNGCTPTSTECFRKVLYTPHTSYTPYFIFCAVVALHAYLQTHCMRGTDRNMLYSCTCAAAQDTYASIV